MSQAPDYVAKKFRPQLARTVEAALAARIAQEFPRIGGPRIVHLCAELVLEVIDAYHYRADTLHHGQMRWTAVTRTGAPGHRQATTGAQLRAITLDVTAPEDVEALLAREPAPARLRRRILRLCLQAYQQDAVLSNCDLALLLHVSETRIAQLLAAHERATHTSVPRRGTLHDMGSCLTHKRIICYKRFHEGKEPGQIARETYHSLAAVERYLDQYTRVRLCRRQGFDAAHIAMVLQCSPRLVHEYFALDDELYPPAGPSPEPSTTTEER